MIRERDKAFFKPLWLRVGLAIVLAAWAVWEWSTAEVFWAVLATGLTGYTVWVLLLNFDPGDGDGEGQKPSE